MKKLTILLLSSVIFLSCNDNITENQEIESHSHQLNKPNKVHPSEEIVPLIESFYLGNNQVISNNEIVTSDFDIDITDNENMPNISFRVSNPIPFLNIRILVFYDYNADGIDLWGSEFCGYIYHNETIESKDLFDEELQQYVKEVDFTWDGKIEPLNNDPIYGIEYDGGDYELKDQLMSIYPSEYSEKAPSDRYGISFEVFSGDIGQYSTFRTSFMWLTANDPDYTFHIENIEFLGLEPYGRRDVRPKYKILIADDVPNGQIPGAWVFGDFFGVFERDNWSAKEIIGDGSTILYGPAFGKNKVPSGNIILTIKSVNQFGWVFNPANNLMSSITISLPEGEVVP